MWPPRLSWKSTKGVTEFAAVFLQHDAWFTGSPKKNSKSYKEGTAHSHTPQKAPLPDFLQLLQKYPSLGLAKACWHKKQPTFIDFIWAKMMTYAREQNFKCSREKQYCSFFYVFEIKERKEGRLQEDRRKQERGWITGLLRLFALQRVVISQKEGSERLIHALKGRIWRKASQRVLT